MVSVACVDAKAETAFGAKILGEGSEGLGFAGFSDHLP